MPFSEIDLILKYNYKVLKITKHAHVLEMFLNI